MFDLPIPRSPLATNDLYSLSQGPLERYTSYHSCIINGVRFHYIPCDYAFQTQCLGVCTKGEYNNEDIIYYESCFKSYN